MSDPTEPRDGCEAMRKTIQDGQDGPLSTEDVRALEVHLAGCADCRDYERGIEMVREALRVMPLHRFPDEALERVWDRTVRAEVEARRRFGWVDWRPLAAAAVLAAALFGIWLLGDRATSRHEIVADNGPGRETYSAQEIERARAELELVLGVTAQTVRQAEAAAVGGVLANEVSPALSRIPVLGGPPSGHRRSGT